MSKKRTHLSTFQDRRTIVPAEMSIGEIIQGVYCGFDTRNGEPLYVGLSENIRNRVYQHIQQLNRQSKAKVHWDEDFKAESALVEWKLLEIVEDRSELNDRESYWWAKLGKPRLNLSKISSKAFRTGGNTRKRHPGLEELSEMRLSGMTVPEMATKLGVTDSAVYGWFRNASDPIHEFAAKRTATSLRQKSREFLEIEANLRLVTADVESGLGILTVSTKYGLSREIVYAYLNRQLATVRG